LEISPNPDEIGPNSGFPIPAGIFPEPAANVPEPVAEPSIHLFYHQKQLLPKIVRNVKSFGVL
jgi:hypothetical protein